MLTNRHNLPEALVKAMARDNYTGGKSDATVSSLHEPPRVVLLKQKHRSELTSDVSERINALLGTAFHHIAEMAATEGDVVEHRYYADVLGWNISGQIDAYTPAEKYLRDWKVLSVWSVTLGTAVEEYTKKLNTYAYLMRANGKPVEKLSIVVLFRDWQAREARYNPEYPQQQCIEYDLAVWPEAEAEAYVRALTDRHQQARIGFDRDGSLPVCTKEEMWAKPEKYAVYKGSNVKATKLFDNMSDAKAFVGGTTQGMRIEHRRGEQTRCMFFCPVRDFCEVGKSLQIAAEAAH